MKILITGCAGFIGFHLTRHLLNFNHEITGIDCINDYYDVNLKYGRLAELGVYKENIVDSVCLFNPKYTNFKFLKIDLTNKESLQNTFNEGNFDIVCNLAAQAGVRYSLINPQAYIDSNIQGFFNLLECCRASQIKHLLYASSSSVYGLNTQMPFSTDHIADKPASLYAATKKCNELMAHSYSHLFNIPTTGLRFFTVYGPWGRPDMALYIFTKAIIEKKPIPIFNMGDMKRDFTYVDDVVMGITKIIDKPFIPENNGINSATPYRVFNIGKGTPVALTDFITEIEKNVGSIAQKEYLPLQDGDIAATWSDVTDLENEFDYRPSVTVAEGVKNFVKWYKAFYCYKKDMASKEA